MTPTLMFIFPGTFKKKKHRCAFNKSGVNFHVKSFYFWISLEGKKKIKTVNRYNRSQTVG